MLYASRHAHRGYASPHELDLVLTETPLVLIVTPLVLLETPLVLIKAPLVLTETPLVLSEPCEALPSHHCKACPAVHHTLFGDTDILD